jgi:muramoyltetrapeptide carboxypeptidase
MPNRAVTLRFDVPLKPKRLNLGDTLGLVSPASPPPDPRAIDYGIAAIEKLGFKVKLGRHARKRHGFLAGIDRERAADLMRMFTDTRVNAILCVRGGYGSARLLSLLDFDLIRANPKVFVGYSDLTSLHFALLKKANLVSFHGPMLNSDFIREKFPPFTRDSFLRNVAQAEPAGSILQGKKPATARIIHPGVASGPLIGGNLSLICTMLGTPYQVSFRGRILFLEDVEEPPYRFDRMLTHLLNSGLLQQVAGIAIGSNTSCDDPKAKRAREYRQTIEDVLWERLRPLRVPVLSGLPFGHVPLNATLPLGIRATINTSSRDLVINEAAVA